MWDDPYVHSADERLTGIRHNDNRFKTPGYFCGGPGLMPAPHGNPGMPNV